jgi:hypothetical protein
MATINLHTARADSTPADPTHKEARTVEMSRLTNAVEALLPGAQLQEALRKNPEAFARQHELTADELNALLEGDEMRLLALGVPPQTLYRQQPDRSWLTSALLRTAAPALAILAAIGVMFGPGAPTALAARRARFGIVVRRSRASGRIRVHPQARRSLRHHGVRDGIWLRTNVRAARFARAGAFGTFTDQKSALAALREVDPNIGETKGSDGGK